MTKKYFTIEDYISQPGVCESAINSNGEYIAYTKEFANWQENKYESDLWLYIKSLKKTLKITNSGFEIKWWGDYLAYVAQSKDNGYQIFVFNPKDFTSKQVTFYKKSIVNFKWAPNGKGFYFLANNDVDLKLIEREKSYADFTIIDEEYTLNALYYTELNDLSLKNTTSKKYTKILDGDFYIRDFDVSSDNTNIACTVTKTPFANEYLNKQLILFNLTTNTVKEIDNKYLVGGRPTFSPQGDKLCYLQTINEVKDKYLGVEVFTLAIYDLQNDQVNRPIIDFNHETQLITWNKQGIIFRYNSKSNRCLALLTDDNRIKDIFTDNSGDYMSVSSSLCGNHLSYVKANSEHYYELYYNNNKVTSFTDYSEKKLCIKEHITWHNSEELQIGGVLTLPEDFDKSKKYPLLVVVHGGPKVGVPLVHASNRFYSIESFIQKGFIVLEPNYRGSVGYGKEFIADSYRKMSIAEYNDIISGVDFLIEQGFVLKDDIGLMGWSHGGYIAAYCSTYSTRFKAISVGAGISDWKTYFIQTDIPVCPKTYLGNDPWSDRDIYHKTSPMKHIKSACTPTLIQHGKHDRRVPVANAYELYRGLKENGVETKFVLFNNMGHKAHNPNMQKTIMKQNLLWFSHYILGENLDNLII